ncbi:hypothetical protein ACMT4L_14125 [Deinococcus sp. A31D244]|uniref:hypothetical protein n=1 Tax=Deinococcus sp. A31D244 TaxID=3397675 RepID=UPI0039E149B7
MKGTAGLNVALLAAGRLRLVAGRLGAALLVLALPGSGVARGGPLLPNAEVARSHSEGPLRVQWLACQAAGRPDLRASLTLQASGPLYYRVVSLDTNDAAHTLLQAGQNVPQVRGLFARYVTQGQPLGRVTLAGLLGTWKLFGLKFDWQGATYRCQMGDG